MQNFSRKARPVATRAGLLLAPVLLLAAGCADTPRAPAHTHTLRGAATVEVAGVVQVAAGRNVTLDASTLPWAPIGVECRWEQLEGTPTPTNDVDRCNMTFRAPLERGHQIWRVFLKHGTNDTAVDYGVRIVNHAPQVKVSAPASAAGGSTVHLHAKGTDEDNHALRYRWTRVSGPRVDLTGKLTPTMSFTAGPTRGTALRFRVSVTDGVDLVDSNVVTVIVGNQAPTAWVGDDQTASPGESVTIDGGGQDIDGDDLTYTWSQVSGPMVALGLSAQTPTVTFAAPMVKSQVMLKLVVSDGQDASLPAYVKLHVTNTAPSAVVHGQVSAEPGATVVLHGHLSGDADGDMLTYSWEQLAGPSVTIIKPQSAQASFLAPDWRTLLAFRLTVGDGDAHDTADVIVTVANQFPVAVVAPMQNTKFGDVVVLDASASFDPDEDALHYKWTRLSGPVASLYGADSATPSFVAPDVPAQFVFGVRACDDIVCSPQAKITVHVDNAAPHINVPFDALQADGGSLVSLVALASDADGDEVTFNWEQTAGEPVAMSWPQTPSPTFIAPMAAQLMSFDVTVSDGYAEAVSTITVSINNHAPTVEVGADQIVEGLSSVTLTAMGADLDGHPLTYQWTQVDGIPVDLSSATVASPTLAAPAPRGDLVFEVVAYDGSEASAPATAVVTVRNNAPVADAGQTSDVAVNANVSLSGVAIDIDGDELTFHWAQIGGLGTVLTDGDTAAPTFVAPDTKTQCVFELIVTDELGTASQPATVIVNVGNAQPVANAGPDQSVGPGAYVMLDGSGTQDGDDDALEYVWSQLQGETVALSDYSVASPTFIAPTAAQTLRFALTAFDGWGWAETAEVEIVIGNVAPKISLMDDFAVDGGDQVTLAAEVVDANDDDLTWSWEQTGGETVSIEDLTSLILAFKAPATKQLLSFRFSATDEQGAVSQDDVHITVNNHVPHAMASGPALA
ncbi:MAG: hypothetical protein ACI9WU_002006, partial [Myxococcota bacterium]